MLWADGKNVRCCVNWGRICHCYEESEGDDEQWRFRDFLLSGNFNCSKEVNGGWCCLLYCGLRREKDLPKSSIEKRRVFRSWLMRDSWGCRWSRMRENVRSLITRLPIRRRLETRRFRFTRAPLAPFGDETVPIRTLSLLAPFEIKSIRLPPESACLHLIPLNCNGIFWKIPPRGLKSTTAFNRLPIQVKCLVINRTWILENQRFSCLGCKRKEIKQHFWENMWCQ